MTELDILDRAIDRYRENALYEPLPEMAEHLASIANALEQVRDDILDQSSSISTGASKAKRPQRIAPGRRLVLVRARSRKEALAATKLMVQQLMRNCSDKEDKIVQSFYLDEDGTGWFG